MSAELDNSLPCKGPTTSTTKISTSVDAQRNPDGRTEESKTHTDFVMFGKLPPELRTKIWDEAAAGVEGRIVEVRWSEKYQRFLTDCTIPGVLQACHVSRIRALKVYTQIHVPGVGLPQNSGTGNFVTCIKYSCDILYFCPTGHDTGIRSTQLIGSFLSALITNSTHGGTQGLQHIAFEALTFNARNIIPTVTPFNLRSINLVYGDACVDGFLPLHPHGTMEVSVKHTKALGYNIRDDSDKMGYRYRTVVNFSIRNMLHLDQQRTNIQTRLQEKGWEEKRISAVTINAIDVLREKQKVWTLNLEETIKGMGKGRGIM